MSVIDLISNHELGKLRDLADLAEPPKGIPEYFYVHPKLVSAMASEILSLRLELSKAFRAALGEKND